MKKAYAINLLFFSICCFSLKAQINQYDQPASSNATDTYIDTYVSPDWDFMMKVGEARKASYDRNIAYRDKIIDWIFNLKTKSNDKRFLSAMDNCYKQLRAMDGKDFSQFGNELDIIKQNIKEEIDKCNTRAKERPQKLWDSGNENVELKSEPAAFSARGWTKYYLKDYMGALVDFNKEIELEPSAPDGYYNRGSAKSELGDQNGAIIDYTKSINLNPNFSMAFNNRGWAKYELKKYSEALKDLNKAIELDPANWVAYDSRQETKFALNDLKGCIEDCNTALSLNSNISNSYFFRGRAYYKQGNKTQACADWSKSGELGNAEAYKYISKYCK
jgi:tetratricopeptide (TPR) repeat protein